MPRFRSLTFLLIPLLLLLLVPQKDRPSAETPSVADLRQLSSTLASSISSTSQPNLPLTAPIPQPDLTLPPLDHTPLQRQAKALEQQGRYRFATPRPTDITPHHGGTWTTTKDRALWQYHLHSINARSLNLGFSEFDLPPNSTLTISDPTGNSQPIAFTSKSNDDHNQLWTPVFSTDRLTLTLNLPKELAPDLSLRLTSVNHGFRSKTPEKLQKAIGDSTSGSCNIDVICDASNDSTFGPFVDLFRDQIRSVAAYTIGGIETCSGALINNTRNDLTPYFLTADHCGITAQNAASVVVYWNFENSTCRTPNSSSSGSNGDGIITQFNSGAILRASRSQSDFCLIELDDPVDPSFEPFYAGWDRSGVNPPSVTGIHHPGVAEKRIAFDFDATTITSYLGDSSSANGTHIRVSDWDFGTTEGGSSGSPLFDETGKIIGQLHGGEAACGNDLPDWYGRISRSWSDGTTASTQLAQWLDPINSGVGSIDGINSDEILSVSSNTVNEGDSGNTTTEVTVSLSKATDETVTVTLTTEADTATSDDFVALTEVITFNPGQTSKTIPVSIIGDTTPEEHETFLLQLIDAQNATPSGQPGEITILNDDFIQPVINSTLSASGSANTPFEYRITAQNTPTSYSIADQPQGMSIEPLTGVITWVPNSPGTETVTIIATNPAGEDSQTLTITSVPNNLATALELTSSSSILNSSPGWFRQTSVTSDGIDAAQADSIGDGGIASFSVQVTGPDLVEFQYRVSSESGYDFLTISLDDVEQNSYSGEIGWQLGDLEIPSGSHTVTFSYTKDGSVSDGADTAWIDSFILASDTGIPAISSPRSLTIDSGSDFNYAISSVAQDASFTVTNLPSGLVFDGDSTISGTVTDPGTYSIGIRATTPTQEEEIVLSLEVLIPIGPSVEVTHLTWTREGDSIWYGQNGESFDGVDSARSGDIDDNETSSISIDVTGPERMSFQWKVSSEGGYDELSFLLDGQPYETLSAISGEQDWAPVFINIPSGSHTLTWQYEKDGSESRGQDAAWLDDIRFASGQRLLIWANEQSAAVTGSTSRIPVDFINSESYEFTEIPDWLVYNEESAELVGTPPSAGTYRIIAIASGNGESATRTFFLTVLQRSQSLANALDQPDLITTTSVAPWIAAASNDAVSSNLAHSGQIGNNEESSFTLFVQGPGTLRFNWMVSSEANYDFLAYSLDSVLIAEISGEVSWEQIEIPLTPGPHEITWTYSKDRSQSTGSDRGSVDNVILTGFANFLTEHGFDHTAVTPTDDPDNNGLSLMHEYAFLQTPGSPSKDNLLTLTHSTESSALSFEGLPPISGMEYFIESSSSLAAPQWTILPGPLENTPLSGTTRYSLNIPFPSPDHATLFYRIRTRFQ